MITFDVKVEIPRFGGYAPRRKVRVRIGKLLRDSIQRRVQTTGHGASGPVKGYSEHPFLLAASNEGRLKPIVLPNTSRGSNKVKKFRATSFENTSGIPYVFYAGGVRQYKRETGQESNMFVLTNRGALWRDWQVEEVPLASGGSVRIGFSRLENYLAAKAAEDNGRPDLLDPSDSDIEALETEALAAVMEMLVGKN